ncbi:hypothetical protein KIW84_034203 [Lathyrus oleraceus]|uniref:Retrovirus-related Pol polyprotein from transposon RE1 n=1 Tax=Pisum sativum TaxID=3888 RepID=A0A9D4XYR9_PEA|nr:hypothetical protein KIW84_034203 [Pisum sativum]
MANSENNSPPPPSPPPVSSTDGEASHVTFQLKISEKLTEKNFPIWRQQVDPIINAHNLQDYIYFPPIPSQFVQNTNSTTLTENPQYRAWIRQDQWLLSWLQSILFGSFMSRVLGCTKFFDLWEQIHAHFQKLTHAKARQLRSKLRAAVLGLPHEFGPIVLVIESKFEDIQLEEVKTLLIAHEMCSEKLNKISVVDNASINLTQVKPVSDVVPSMHDGNSPKFLQSLTQQLNHSFSLKELGDLDYFLGIEVKTNWAADLDDCRFVFGSTLYFGSNLISWRSCKQIVVARSSAEVEYRSLALTTAEVLWVQTLLQELHIHIASFTIVATRAHLLWHITLFFMLVLSIWKYTYFLFEKRLC